MLCLFRQEVRRHTHKVHTKLAQFCGELAGVGVGERGGGRQRVNVMYSWAHVKAKPTVSVESQ